MLITMPDFDLPTSYITKWSEKLVKIGEKNGLTPIVLKGKNVNKNHITYSIMSKNPKLLIFNGHGSSDSITGQDNEPIIILGENDNLLESKIIHAFACNSAKDLGFKCRAESFIGYNDWFWLCMDRFGTNRPLDDKFAQPLLESAIEAPLQLVKRNTTGEAFEKSQQKYQEWIDKFTISSSKYTTEELQLILPLLTWNKSIQVIHGNRNAKR
ncbi:MAG: hypothetical protein J4473_02035 [Candidatus Aenigmarchaeota archaeon]|nr:hypothetical protein [Candidatus Aenigmarchaeota archaeon]